MKKNTALAIGVVKANFGDRIFPAVPEQFCRAGKRTGTVEKEMDDNRRVDFGVHV